jgi:hypothetical protein
MHITPLRWAKEPTATSIPVDISGFTPITFTSIGPITPEIVDEIAAALGIPPDPDTCDRCGLAGDLRDVVRDYDDPSVTDLLCKDCATDAALEQ